MADLVLGETEQAAVRAVIASQPVRGLVTPGGEVLRHLARLIHCDAVGIAVLDGAGGVVDQAAAGRDRTGVDGLPSGDGPAAIGIQQRHLLTGHSSAGPRRVAVLSLGVPSGKLVVTLWLVRRRGDFSGHDRALLRLVAPALERVLRERPQAVPASSLTVQERRVLLHVAAGLSNAEIAQRLFVAPCTVRKHLENAYRKLGVSNRLAAVHALDERLTTPDRADRLHALV